MRELPHGQDVIDEIGIPIEALTLTFRTKRVATQEPFREIRPLAVIASVVSAASMFVSLLQEPRRFSTLQEPKFGHPCSISGNRNHVDAEYDRSAYPRQGVFPRM